MYERKEIARTSVEVEGRVYGLIVFHETNDGFDDPEGRVSERVTFFTDERRMPDEPVDWRVGSDLHQRFVAGAFETGNHTVRDGGRMMRELSERSAEREATYEREHKARLAKVTDETPRVEQREHSCGHVGDLEDYQEPAYECGRCGQTEIGEDGRRCSTCNIFCAKVADLSCPDCQEPIEDEGDLATVVGVEVDGVFLPEADLKQ